MKIFDASQYSIYLGDVRDGLAIQFEKLNYSSAFILCDEHTSSLCVPIMKSCIPNAYLIEIRSGELNKNIETCQHIWTKLSALGADRNSVLINCGGGVICDMGGFVASSYQRGIRFVHIPTTLMSMADASIGGKVGIDFLGFKNYLGFFKNPAFIWVDPSFLKTLEPGDIRSGMAEVVKHAIIGSRDLWDLLIDYEVITEEGWLSIFEKSIPLKVKIVDQDPYDHGIRKVLNFGHTIGHAIESYYLTLGQPMTHGDCVALGMILESHLALQKEMIKSTEYELIMSIISRILTPDLRNLPSYENLISWLAGDKKRNSGQLAYSLPDGIGSCKWDVEVPEALIIRSFDFFSSQV